MTKFYSFTFKQNLLWTLRNLANFIASEHFNKDIADITIELFNDMDYHECRKSAILKVIDTPSRSELFYMKYEDTDVGKSSQELKKLMEVLELRTFKNLYPVIPFCVFLDEKRRVTCTLPAPGISIYRVMKRGPSAEGELINACRCLGEGFAAIHQTPFEIHEAFEQTTDLLQLRLRNYRNQFKNSRDAIAYRVADHLLGNMSKYLVKSSKGDFGLVHSDPTPSNLFFDNGATPSIHMIEAESMKAGLKAMDIIWFAEYLKIYSLTTQMPLDIVEKGNNEMMLQYKKNIGDRIYSEESYFFSLCYFWVRRKSTYSRIDTNWSIHENEYLEVHRKNDDFAAKELERLAKGIA